VKCCAGGPDCIHGFSSQTIVTRSPVGWLRTSRHNSVRGGRRADEIAPGAVSTNPCPWRTPHGSSVQKGGIGPLLLFLQIRRRPAEEAMRGEKCGGQRGSSFSPGSTDDRRQTWGRRGLGEMFFRSRAFRNSTNSPLRPSRSATALNCRKADPLRTYTRNHLAAGGLGNLSRSIDRGTGHMLLPPVFSVRSARPYSRTAGLGTPGGAPARLTQAAAIGLDGRVDRGSLTANTKTVITVL